MIYLEKKNFVSCHFEGVQNPKPPVLIVFIFIILKVSRDHKGPYLPPSPKTPYVKPNTKDSFYLSLHAQSRAMETSQHE